MAKNIFFVLIILVLIAVVFRKHLLIDPSPGVARVKISGQEFNLVIAKTLNQKTKGLMGQTVLPEDQGMIFVSAFESPQAFWMKNTLIPLDMIFLDKNGRVVNIETALPEPGVSDFNLKLYRSLKPAKYVIELNAGTAAKINLVSGDIISLPAL